MRGYRPYWNRVTNAYHLLGEHDPELDAALEARERHPERRSALALDRLETRPADERETVDHRLRLCQALMFAGRDAEALEVARELMAANDGCSAFPMYVGVISARLGDRAMTLLRRAFAEGLAYGPDLHTDPRLKPLRDHPPFQELVRPDG